MPDITLWNTIAAVPETAKKPIGGGRLKGMTDINPVWRLKTMTEQFGKCGFGWWYEISEKNIVYDEITKTKQCFVDILLYFKDPETGEISRGIPGTGGASYVAQERNGAQASDECFKMALTDALSVAMKALGMGADVYWENGRSKYNPVPQNTQPKQNNTMPTKKPPALTCYECGQEIKGYTAKSGSVISVESWAGKSIELYGKPLCITCAKKKEEGENA